MCSQQVSLIIIFMLAEGEAFKLKSPCHEILLTLLLSLPTCIGCSHVYGR